MKPLTIFFIYRTRYIGLKTIVISLIIFGFFGTPVSGMAQRLNSDLFQPSTMISSEIARKQLKKIYLSSGKRRTLHCGCVFDKLNQVFPHLCSDGPVSETGKSKKMIWASLMPPNIFAKSLTCWNKNQCGSRAGKKVKRTQCCSEVSPNFKTRESDMHNIFPMIEDPASNIMAKDFFGIWEYRYCKKEGNLRKEIRGNASRAYLYMSFQYKIPLTEKLENSLRSWHFEDPPDEWEEKRNDLIEVIQGNRNPFIDRPELVERVTNF